MVHPIALAAVGVSTVAALYVAVTIRANRADMRRHHRIMRQHPWVR